MTNRVTDQETQNALIEAFRLEGLLPEMAVSPVIIPVVITKDLGGDAGVTEFEKWRSVFSGSVMMVDRNNNTAVTSPLATAVTNVLASTNVVGNGGLIQLSANYGCALPGGSPGNDATDGIYRITITQALIGLTRHRVDLHLYDQAAFGLAVALGTDRGTIGSFNIEATLGNKTVVWDAFLRLRTADLANAVVMKTAAAGVNGTGSISMTVTKLISELPPFVIFP